LLPHGYAIGSIFQSQECQYYDVLEFAQVLARHITYNIEQIPERLNILLSPAEVELELLHSGAQMLRVVLLCIAVLIVVLFVPRLLSRSKAPAVGSAVPDFSLPSQDGSLVRLKNYRGKWVVLYFYLKDQTPG
jgi:hypothetical protein